MIRKRLLIGICISLIFLYLAIRNIEFDRILEEFENISYIYIIPVIFFTLLSYIIRAWRWQYFFRHIKVPHFSSLFSAVMIGFMANNIFPARIGEIVRAYCIGKKENISKSMVLSTIILERAFDGFSLLFLFIITLICYPLSTQIVKIGYIGAIIYLIATIILIFIKVCDKYIIKLTTLLCRYLPEKIKKTIIFHISSFISGFNVFKSTRDIILILSYSILLWLTSAISFYFMLIGCNITQIPFIASFIILITTAIGIAIPSSPGYIGTFQYFVILSLSVFNVDKNTALTYSIILHVTQIIVPVIIGWICLCKEQISFSEMKVKS